MKRSLLFLCFALVVFNCLCQNNDIREQIEERYDYYESLSEPELELMRNSKEIKEFNRYTELVEDKISNSVSGSTLNDYSSSMKNILNNLDLYKSGSGAINPVWEELGPIQDPPQRQNMGRVECVATPQGSNFLQILYAGSPSSGIWKTLDGGATWNNITDATLFQSGFGCSHIVIDAENENHLYACINMSSVSQYNEIPTDGFGLGIYESVDAGENWSETGLVLMPTDETPIHRIVANPINSQQMYAFGNDEVYRTLDGWSTYEIIFENLLTNPDGLGSKIISDLEVNPHDFNEVFLSSIGTSKNGNYSPAELWHCQDCLDGVAGWTPNYSFSPDFDIYTSESTLMNIELDFSDDGQNTYLFAAQREFGNIATVSSSIDFGSTFTQVISDEAYNDCFQCINMGGLAQRLAVFEVSPNDPNVFYIGGIVFSSYTNGVLLPHPTSYSGNPDFHVDLRYLELVQGTPFGQVGANDVLLCGNDGGVSIIRRNSLNETEDENINGVGLGNLQFYGFDLSSETDTKIVGGAMDNGSFANQENQWTNYQIGDGYNAILSHTNTGRGIILNNEPGGMRVTPNFGLSWNDTSGPVDINDTCFPRRCDGALVKDPQEADKYYLGYDVLYEGSFENQTWTALNDHNAGRIRAVAVNSSNSDYKYIAYSEPYYGLPDPDLPKLLYTNDNASTWIDITEVTGNLLNWWGISEIISHPRDPKILYFSRSGVSNGDGTGRIYRITLDEDDLVNSNLEDISSGLPDVPLNCLQFIQGTSNSLIAGNDVGVYMFDGAQWDCISQTLPVCTVSDIEIDYDGNRLYISTYGRGIWSAQLDCIQNDALIISEDETWANYDMLVDRNVHVADGATLTITSKINFAKHTAIKVEPGGTLRVLEGGHLSSACPDELWIGIEVWGQDNLIQNTSNQGFCRLDNAIIENAHTGVWLRQNDEDCQEVSGTGGGIVMATNTTFYNCYIGAEFAPYRWYSSGDSPYPNNSYFLGCTFDFDRVLNGGFDFKYGIHLKEVNAVKINGCYFSNRLDGSTSFFNNNEPFGIGIKSTNASFSIGNYAGERTEFHNLTNGIYASHIDVMNTFRCNDALFSKCLYSLNARQVSGLILKGNDIYVTPVITEIIDPVPYGVHLEGCTGYVVEENNFYGLGAENEIATAGIVITDSNIDVYDMNSKLPTESYNRIYRNIFQRLYVGTLAQGLNASANSMIGLELLCGNYRQGTYRNEFNIALTHDAVIEAEQGSDLLDDVYSSGNWFQGDYQELNEGNLYVDDFDGSQGFQYFHSIFNPPNNGSYSTTPPVILSDIDVDYNYDETCPTSEEGGIVNIEATRAKYLLEKSIGETLSLEYTNLVDGGDHASVVSIISNPFYESWELRNLLYPFMLSDESLILLMERNPSLEEWHLTDLLIANSPLSYTVIQKYYELNPLQDFFHSLLMLYQDGTSSIANIKKELKKASAARDKAKTDYLTALLLDVETDFVESQSINDVILLEDDCFDLQRKFFQAMSSGDLATAQNYLSTYPRDESEDGFVIIAGIMIDHQNEPLGNIQLSLSEIQSLQEIAETSIPGKYMAQSILENYSGIVSVEIVKLPVSTKGMNAPVLENKAQELELFNVYPNPSSGISYVTFNLPDQLESAQIEVRDVKGKLIDSIDISAVKNVFQLDLTGNSNGTYIVSLTVDNRLIMNKKLIMTK